MIVHTKRVVSTVGIAQQKEPEHFTGYVTVYVTSCLREDRKEAWNETSIPNEWGKPHCKKILAT
jgi:hypothetical protein